MENILAPFLSFLLLYKYLALLIVSFLGAFLLPVPSSSALAAAGAFAAQGYLNLPEVLFVALLGNIGGDAAGYLLARHYEEAVLHKVGFKKILRSPKYHPIEAYTQEFSYSIIFLSRFLPEVGPAVNIIAGLAKMSYLKYFTIEVIGEICYVLLYGLAGFYLGNEWQNNIWFLVETGLVLFSFAGIIALVQYWLFKHRKKKLML